MNPSWWRHLVMSLWGEWMPAPAVEDSGDRLILYLEPRGPVEVTELTGSLAALARMYQRHYRTDPEDGAPKLYVTRLESGSVLAEIAPYAALMGQIYPFVDQAVTIADFSKRVVEALKGFAGITIASSPGPSREDTADLRAFVGVLTGKRGAQLKITHARYRKRDGDKETEMEFAFDENAINRAALNMDRQLDTLPTPDTDRTTQHLNEVFLYFERASRSPGKERGKATDWAFVPDASEKPLPTYFKNSVRGNIKDMMVRSDVNALGDVGFIVDVAVQKVDGEPKVYIVTDLHHTVPLGPPE
jgi:hypothetical protein